MIKRLARISIAVLSLALATGCQVTTSPDSDLDGSRQRWALKRPQSYDITVHRICFCGTEVTNPVLVSVRDGVITSRTYVGSGAQVGASFAQYFPNVEGLYLIIDDAQSRKAAKLDVSYDPTYGYPVNINIDYVLNAVDDELTVQMSNFTVR